jgi:outer membrane receptor protein involved in Fe transport
MQLGFYAQDQWTINPQFTLTGGLRLDIPVITTDPALDEVLRDTLDVFAAAYPIASDVVPGKAPDGQLMFSPRLGFEYAFNETRNTILRGGLGIFTSRIPFVWPGAMFTNNGLTIGRVDETNITGGVQFRADVNNQYENPNFSIPQGQVDLFVNDFKYPQVFRANLAVDTKFGDGFEFLQKH